MKAENKSVFIHHTADVQTTNIGSSTFVWQFSIILKDAVIGENCNINSHTFIENKVRIGNRVTVKCGVYLWDGITVEDDVFIGPNATFVNDIFPRSKQYPEIYSGCVLKQGCSIGANATILGNVSIGKFALVGAGSVVTKNVSDNALVVGNPAKMVGWVSNEGNKLLQKRNTLYVDSKTGQEYNLNDNIISKINR